MEGDLGSGTESSGVWTDLGVDRVCLPRAAWPPGSSVTSLRLGVLARQIASREG